MHRETWIQTQTQWHEDTTHMHISTHTDISKETQNYTHTHKNTCTDTQTHSYMAQKHMCRTTLRLTHTLAFLASGFRLGTFPICTQSSLSPLLPAPREPEGPGRGRLALPPPLRSPFWGRTQEGRGLVGGGLGLPHLSLNEPPCDLHSGAHLSPTHTGEDSALTVGM